MSKMTIELQRINYIITDKINNIICRIRHSTRCKIFRVNRFSEMDTLFFIQEENAFSQKISIYVKVDFSLSAIDFSS